MLRAFITVKEHPKIEALELKTVKIPSNERKKGYATHQLLETNKSPEEIERELTELVQE